MAKKYARIYRDEDYVPAAEAIAGLRQWLSELETECGPDDYLAGEIAVYWKPESPVEAPASTTASPVESAGPVFQLRSEP
jgi:hypothetical protein